ncbi:hypothetical protein [Rufibacter latericius]|uniref:Uncharacterized protein n=1 Tax=Rufibacter latericius TaxID=2487040 RepID=A0A3M9MH66_9BACT|nr:hypothetical protein [Rufibacter latericius]RNI24525.1 hypothetical protein EFB08_16555 [Rufibacter latericius]
MNRRPSFLNPCLNSFRKALRLAGLIFLVVLASVGIGIGGGMPLPAPSKKETNVEITAEADEPMDQEKTAMDLLDLKS